MILAILCGLAVGRAVVASPIAPPITNVWLSPLPALSPLRQYHIQDGSGSYKYSFTGPHHAKAESTSNGITQGGYSYIDANGVLQTVSYTADDENGFRVSASNLPQPPRGAGEPHQTVGQEDTPEVAAAKRHHLEELQKSRQADWRDQNLLSYKILPSYFSLAQIRQEDGAEEDGRAEPNLNRQETESTKNPFLLSRSEAERIDVPRPDPSLAKITSAPSSGPTASSFPSSSSSLSFQPVPTITTSFFPARERAPPSPPPPPHLLLKNEAKRNVAGAQQLAAKYAPLATTTVVHQRHPVAALPAQPYLLPLMPYRLLHSSLHHTQDSLGQYDYSYTGDSSAKTESRSLDGTTRGAYSYIDPNGILQQVHYVADHNGFRVLATNLPEAK